MDSFGTGYLSYSLVYLDEFYRKEIPLVLKKLMLELAQSGLVYVGQARIKKR
jgi:hypothetical protein